MGRQYSLPDYYAEMYRLAGTYGISDNHAGCYICQYPNGRLCDKCRHRETCDEICEKEKN